MINVATQRHGETLTLLAFWIFIILACDSVAGCVLQFATLFHLIIEILKSESH